jgi:nucleoside-diphosphate-sugar epimerase
MAIRGKKVFLTGGSGFIGTALARRLVDANEVVVYDNQYRGASTRISHRNLKLIKGDVLDAAKLARSMRGAELVVHLASIAGVDTVIRMPVTTMKVALLGTFNLLEAALAEKKVERLIDFSTSEVFGSYAYNVREGDLTPMGAVGTARWTYAVSKLASEHLAHNYHAQYGLPALSVRPFNIYGPGQVGEGAIHRFVVRALRGEDLEVHNDGSQIRAWCYIDDIVDGILLCLSKPEAIGHSFNIGNPRSVVTVHELARLVVRFSGSTSKIVFVKKEMVDVALRIPNIDKARKVLGFEPQVDLDEGLSRTIEWYRRKVDA